MQQLELFGDEPLVRERLTLAWDPQLNAHVYFDRDDPAWRGMSVCLFNQARGYAQTCRLCAGNLAAMPPT